MPFMDTEEHIEYTDNFILNLEEVFGAGFLSPGGAEEVAKIVEHIDLAGKDVLDIGVGVAGPACALVQNHGVGHLTGVDIEKPVLLKAAATVEKCRLSDRITLRRIKPGPLPFEEGTYDVVFSKDTIIHIADKKMLFEDVFRILRPGGWLTMSDWCRSEDPFTAEMTEWTEGTGLSFAMQPLKDYEDLLSDAGFVDVSTTDRNAWFAMYSESLAKRLKDRGYNRMVEVFGKEGADWGINRAELRAVVAAQGQLRPGHLRGRKPEV